MKVEWIYRQGDLRGAGAYTVFAGQGVRSFQLFAQNQVNAMHNGVRS